MQEVANVSDEFLAYKTASVVYHQAVKAISGTLIISCSYRCSILHSLVFHEDTSLYRTLHQVPKVSTIEGFYCIQDTSPGPQGVHNRGVLLYTEHFTGSPRCPQ